MQVTRNELAYLPDEHGADGEPEDVVGVGDAEPPAVLVPVFAEHRLLELLAGIAVVWDE